MTRSEILQYVIILETLSYLVVTVGLRMELMSSSSVSVALIILGEWELN